MVAKGSGKLQLISPGTFPDYRKIVAPLAVACWPEFMLQDPVADKHWGALFERFPDYQFGLLDMDTGNAAAMGNSVPLCWEQDFDKLPDEGWDWAFERAVDDHHAGILPNIQCALQVAIHPAYRGQGLSVRMVQAMRSIGRAKGFGYLIAPVRPSQKVDYPLTGIDRYITWRIDGGWPFDAWLRVHARLGAKIIGACHRSMTIRGTVGAWNLWTRLVFPESGIYVVPGGLNPIEIDVDADEGVYVEPNVWMVHSLDQAPQNAERPDL